MPVDIFGRTHISSSSERVTTSGVTLSQVDNTFLRRDGKNAATGNLDLDSHKLINVSDPTDLQDAATKKYVDTNKVSKKGDTMNGDLVLASSTDLSVSRNFGCVDVREGQRFNIYLGNPRNVIYNIGGSVNYIVLETTVGFRIRVNNEDVFVIQKTDQGSVSISFLRDIYMSGARITGLAEPTSDSGATTKKYVDTTAFGPTFSASNTGEQAITSLVFTKVLFPVVAFNTDSCFAESRFTPKKAGVYTVSVYVEFQTVSNSSIGLVFLYKNGVSHEQISGGGGTGAAYNHAIGNTIIKLTNTDYLEIFVHSNIGVKLLGLNFSAAYLRPDV